MIKDNEIVCNMNPFELADPADNRWDGMIGESVIQKKGNRYILAAGRYVPVMREQGYKLVLVRDISQLYEDIRRQMLASLTHEMKTPMTSIMGYADSMRHVNLTQSQKESALRHIYDECGRLGRVNSKLMSLIGMYDNDSINMTETSINEVFETVAALEENNLKMKNISLQYTCRIDKMFIDKDLMISLQVNLIDNAAKASEEGACIYLTAGENTITVRDNGCGIPKDEILRVTEAFYMVDKARSRRAGGIGLGLALCSMIAKLHGADLQIESRTGQGTEVSVVFPK